MKTTFRASFQRDLKQIKDQRIRDRVRDAIVEVEAADELTKVRQVKKLSGAMNYYRIRVGDYRIGIILDGQAVDFVRCLPRRDLYRFFP